MNGRVLGRGYNPFVKFSTSARSGLLLLLAGVGAHSVISLSEHSMRQNWVSTGLSIGLFLLGCGLFCAVHFLKVRTRGKQTLEIGRRGWMVTGKNQVPVALAWRMIRSAELVPGAPAHWVFELKNGSSMMLFESEFTREQWKTICAQLERKLRARKIPVSVRKASSLGAGVEARDRE